MKRAALLVSVMIVAGAGSALADGLGSGGFQPTASDGLGVIPLLVGVAFAILIRRRGIAGR